MSEIRLGVDIACYYYLYYHHKEHPLLPKDLFMLQRTLQEFDFIDFF
jgi:hypothetical protein